MGVETGACEFPEGSADWLQVCLPFSRPTGDVEEVGMYQPPANWARNPHCVSQQNHIGGSGAIYFYICPISVLFTLYGILVRLADPALPQIRPETSFQSLSSKLRVGNEVDEQLVKAPHDIRRGQ